MLGPARPRAVDRDDVIGTGIVIVIVIVLEIVIVLMLLATVLLLRVPCRSFHRSTSATSASLVRCLRSRRRTLQCSRARSRACA